MSGRDTYAMLITSLPRPGALASAKHTPVSRLRLDRRLALLEPDDLQTLRDIESVLDWSRLDMETTDADALEHAEDVLGRLKRPTLRRMTQSRLELRTLVAALRRRAAGEDAPAKSEVWGYGRWLGRIRKNWTAPDFGLGGVYPWLAEADQLLKAGDARAFEHLILIEAARDVRRRAAGHWFDLEAVVAYVLEWNIVARWTTSNAEAASRRFDEMVAEGLGRFGAQDERGIETWV